jgi:hypothetical protein
VLYPSAACEIFKGQSQSPQSTQST